MTEASAYLVEELQGKLESAYNKLISHLRKSSRAISAKEDLANYYREIEDILKKFNKAIEEYPDDDELGKVFDRFSAFFAIRHEMEAKEQKETVSHLISDLKSMAHWRKMETAYGKTLGFSDFRNLRGGSNKR